MLDHKVSGALVKRTMSLTPPPLLLQECLKCDNADPVSVTLGRRLTCVALRGCESQTPLNNHVAPFRRCCVSDQPVRSCGLCLPCWYWFLWVWRRLFSCFATTAHMDSPSCRASKWSRLLMLGVCAIFSNTFSGREDNSSTLSPVYHDTANQTGCGVPLIWVKYILESLWNGSWALKFHSCRDTESRDEPISCPAVFLYFPANICIRVRSLRRRLVRHFPRGNEGALKRRPN